MSKFVKVAFTIGTFLSLLGFVGLVLFLFVKVISGNGLDYYFTGFGYKFSYLGALILISLIPLIMGGAIAFQWWSEKDERDFINKYIHGKQDHSDT
jgi:nitric oxide reductase large subunit